MILAERDVTVIRKSVRVMEAERLVGTASGSGF
jgi:hypothetical protein